MQSEDVRVNGEPVVDLEKGELRVNVEIVNHTDDSRSTDVATVVVSSESDKEGSRMDSGLPSGMQILSYSEPVVGVNDAVLDMPAVVVDGLSLKHDGSSVVPSPKKAQLSRDSSSHEQCRVCQQDKDEDLINLGCQCRGDLAKTHRSCIDTWFRTRGSNKCEICQHVAVNVPPPQSHSSVLVSAFQASYGVWQVDPAFRGNTSQEQPRGGFSPLWVAFSILVGGLLLDILISITLGVSALPVNIIIGVIVVLGLGTALRLAIEFFQDWHVRRVVQRTDPSVHFGYNATV